MGPALVFWRTVKCPTCSHFPFPPPARHTQWMCPWVPQSPQHGLAQEKPCTGHFPSAVMGTPSTVFCTGHEWPWQVPKAQGCPCEGPSSQHVPLSPLKVSWFGLTCGPQWMYHFTDMGGVWDPDCALHIKSPGREAGPQGGQLFIMGSRAMQTWLCFSVASAFLGQMNVKELWNLSDSPRKWDPS